MCEKRNQNIVVLPFMSRKIDNITTHILFLSIRQSQFMTKQYKTSKLNNNNNKNIIWCPIFNLLSFFAFCLYFNCHSNHRIEWLSYWKSKLNTTKQSVYLRIGKVREYMDKYDEKSQRTISNRIFNEMKITKKNWYWIHFLLFSIFSLIKNWIDRNCTETEMDLLISFNRSSIFHF